MSVCEYCLYVYSVSERVGGWMCVRERERERERERARERERDRVYVCTSVHIHMYECTVLSFLCTCKHVIHVCM